MPAFQLQILGPLRLRRGGAEVGAGPHQQRCLLALLLAHEGHPVSVGELVDLLWGANPPVSAVNVIHKYVGLLRRLLEPGLPTRATGSHLIRHGNGYRFAARPDLLDLSRFRQLVRQARSAAPDDALDLYAQALRLGHGRAGDGLATTPGARAAFASLDGEFGDVLVTAAGLAVERGRPTLLLAVLRRAAEFDPLDERVQASLITTLTAAGRRAEALFAYATVRDRLTDELGIGPGRHLRAAHQLIHTL
ncbi:winged helix-turn-helix domain-containing protein [Actinoplanes bogorensis]|uniref:Winged helix-turn-helix domain-containing protein n=1 Tax=Paractinoplanes bogorensis TaxID=1610840 RepID=A0ABS5YJZ6_9ACTN|nr:BTAD domain-containing putative transcriptional regulator [Actinoplanes bogorensis]MBU2663792.1 winged helix-turn-helix domain-containing protein [Actinoplanes bogorensis]